MNKQTKEKNTSKPVLNRQQIRETNFLTSYLEFSTYLSKAEHLFKNQEFDRCRNCLKQAKKLVDEAEEKQEKYENRDKV